MVSNRQARAVAVSALSVAAQCQRVLGFAYVPPLPRITQRQHSNCLRLQAGCDHEEQRLGLSRAELLRQIPPAGVFGALVIGAAAKKSSAALPTTEDYAFGTGSKVNAICNACLYTPSHVTHIYDVKVQTCDACSAIDVSLHHCGLCAGVAYSGDVCGMFFCARWVTRTLLVGGLECMAY